MISRRKIVFVIMVCCVGLLIIGVIASFIASENISYDDCFDNSSYGNSSFDDSSFDDSSYNYDGIDTHAHYEGKEGTVDNHGKIYYDGRVDSHTKGSTKYGDYQADCYMDSDGNIHGKIKTGGHTFDVDI